MIFLKAMRLDFQYFLFYWLNKSLFDTELTATYIYIIFIQLTKLALHILMRCNQLKNRGLLANEEEIIAYFMRCQHIIEE